MTTLSALLLILAGFAATASLQSTGTVSGSVWSPAGQPLAGVVVILSRAEEDDQRLQVTGNEGEFVFVGLPEGVYRLLATLPGYEDEVVEGVQVGRGREVQLDVSLSLVPFSESVVIEEEAPPERTVEPAAPEEIAVEELDLLPLETDRFQEAFPLLPGVVRDPEGRLSFNGSRPSQSILLVNGANVTDPVTGDFAVELPLRAVEAVEVNDIPYSAEYGRVTAAVAEVKTRGGTDEWDLDIGDLIPRLNFRDGTIKGIRAFVPQIAIRGPLKKGRAWFSQGLAYRFVRSRAYDVDLGKDERVLESYDSFTQLDWRVTDRHDLTTTVSYFPGETDNLGLNALRYAEATPEFHSSGWNWALSERSRFGETLVESTVAVKRFDLSLTPRLTTPALLTPDGPRRNYFNEIDRESSRVDVSSVVTRPIAGSRGRHLVKAGASLGRSRFSGIDSSLPVEIVDGGGKLLRRIDFLGDPGIEGSDVTVSAFAQDRWRLNDRLGIELGLRYDYDRLLGEHHLVPRFAAAYALDARGRTVLRGGFGIFRDHVFLHVASFEDFQRRVETRYRPDGEPVGPPVVFRNRIGERLDTPKSTTWSVEIDRFVSDVLEVRVSYQERRGSEEMIVDRLIEGGSGVLELSSSGNSLAREFGVTARVATGNGSEIFAAYAKSRSTGDLNNFETLYQNLRSPLVFENEDTLFELDVPHRLLLWGIWTLPRDIQISPGIEWRSGFPYTVFDVAYDAVGGLNRGGRFPRFFSLDIRATKGVTLKGRKVRLGVQVFNLGSHFNPRDAVSNLGSARFGRFLNSVDMGISFRVTLGS